jgi:uncharacterized protein
VEQSTPIRIIAVDGGGVGGVIPARMIERLAAAHPGLLEKADLFAGTSTGGLIALGLAKGLTPTQLVDLYRQDANTIFGDSMRRWRVQWMLQAKYRPDGLRTVIGRLLGDQTLKDLAKPVFIPVTALKRPDRSHVPAGVFFSTVYRLFNAPEKQRYRSGDWSCVDAALATSAAPTYFPAHRVNDPRVGGEWLLWDGGLVANNPALAAIAELSRFVPRDRLSFRVLSLGTGYRDIPIDAGDWGRLNAAPSIISALMDASVGSTAFYLRQGYGDDVIRATPQLAADYGIDDATAVPGLIQMVDDDFPRLLASAPQTDGTAPSLIDWLKTHW